MAGRPCAQVKHDGSRCGAYAVQGSTFCFHHSPDHRAEAEEARRLGGERKRKEHAQETIYDFAGLESVDDIRRLLEIATHDTLRLKNGWQRNRTLNQIARTARQLLETGELEQRVAILERRLIDQED